MNEPKLTARLRGHLTQLAPHIAKRYSSVLLKESLRRIEDLEADLDREEKNHNNSLKRIEQQSKLIQQLDKCLVTENSRRLKNF